VSVPQRGGAGIQPSGRRGGGAVNFHHAIFDLDGTLIDSLPGIAWSVNVALAACGLPESSRDLAPFIGPPIRSILESVSGATDTTLLNRLEQAFRRSYDSDGWRRTALKAGVGQTLRELIAGGLDLWLVTNKPALVTEKILNELTI